MFSGYSRNPAEEGTKGAVRMCWSRWNELIRINVGPTRRELRIGQRVRTCKDGQALGAKHSSTREYTVCVYRREYIYSFSFIRSPTYRPRAVRIINFSGSPETSESHFIGYEPGPAQDIWIYQCLTSVRHPGGSIFA